MMRPIDSNYLTLAECLFGLVLAAAIFGCAVAVVLGASLLSALL